MFSLLQPFLPDRFISSVENLLENTKQQTSRLSQATKVLRALLLLRQNNRDFASISIMREAIALIDEKIELLQNIRSSQDIFWNSQKSSFLISLIVLAVSGDAKQVLLALIAFIGDFESFSHSEASLMSDELSKLADEIDRHINQSQVPDWDDW